MKLKRNLFSLLLCVCMLSVLLPANALADSQKLTTSTETSGNGNKIRVKSVTYDENHDQDEDDYESELEVKFLTRVSWKKGAKVASVKDDQGKNYKGVLTDKDSDECDIYIKNIKEGRSYTIVISGIKKRGTGGYRKLTLNVELPSSGAPEGKLDVAKVTVDEDNDDYDEYLTEIDVKFNGKVTWKKNAKVVSVRDNKGKTYKGVLTDKDSDECEVYIKNLTYGRTYTVKISGIKARGASSYQTLSFQVKVPARSNRLTVKSVDYDEDYDDGEEEYKVTFDFNKTVQRKSKSHIILKDTRGKTFANQKSYVEWDGDECEVYLSKGLTYGKTYAYEIKNVRAKGDKSYTTLKGSFIVE